MTEKLRDMMNARAEAAPGPDIDIRDVMRNGQRRVWRNRTTGGTAVCAAVAATALVVPAMPGIGGDDAGFATGEFTQRELTYAKGSTIHYGGQKIDVSPHEVWSFVQTDDGFVFAAENGDVLLTDGDTTEQIGDGNGDGTLAADDSGSYVSWVDEDGTGDEFVVYDTAARDEITRTPADGDPRDGVYIDDDAPYVRAIDGGTAYWRTGEGYVAWDLSKGAGEAVVAHEDQFYVHDVADGQLAQLWTDGAERPRHVIVSADPHARKPRFPLTERTDLSPSAFYLAASDLFNDSGVFDVASGRDVMPQMRGYLSVTFAQWIDDDTFVARALPQGSDKTNPVDLLICSISDDDCTLSAKAVGTAAEVRFPIGEHQPS